MKLKPKRYLIICCYENMITINNKIISIRNPPFKLCHVNKVIFSRKKCRDPFADYLIFEKYYYIHTLQKIKIITQFRPKINNRCRLRSILIYKCNSK